MWLEKLGIYGMEEIEDIILTGLVIGDPVLLIGSHGTAKTTLCRKLAQALDLKFHAYDASKSLFEDIIGFPNPKSISKGIIDYVPTALSIWDKEFILIDEISRARAESQNKWLEVIRSRKIMGVFIKNLKYIFAAMNPISYYGANPLDEALAGRFIFIIQIPDIKDMDENNIKKIINNSTEDDGRYLKLDEEKQLSKKEKEELKEFLIKVRKNVKPIKEKLNGSIDNYLTKFIKFGVIREVVIDGRRINMIKRNILAYISLLYVQNRLKEFSLDKLKEHFYKVIKYSMPFAAFEENFSETRMKYIHEIAFNSINENEEIFFELKNESDVDKINDEFINKDYSLFKTLVSKLLNKLKDKSNIEEFSDKLKILKKLVKKIFDGEIKPEVNDVERIISAYMMIYDASFLSGKKFSCLHYYGRAIKQGIIETGYDDIKLLKLAYNLSEGQNGLNYGKFKEYIKILKINKFGG